MKFAVAFLIMAMLAFASANKFTDGYHASINKLAEVGNGAKEGIVSGYQASVNKVAEVGNGAKEGISQKYHEGIDKMVNTVKDALAPVVDTFNDLRETANEVSKSLKSVRDISAQVSKTLEKISDFGNSIGETQQSMVNKFQHPIEETKNMAGNIASNIKGRFLL